MPRSEPAYTLGSVISDDGTTIGYRRYGAGSAVVLMHGSMMAANNLTRLAAALSADFTVYLPDRRGRGLSGPYGPDFTLSRAAEDVAALMEQTGARNIFGLSAGAVPILHWALSCPAEFRIALYEPPLQVGAFSPTAWLPRYEREMDQGRLAAAMVTVAKGTKDPALLGLIPRAVLVPLMALALRAQQAQGDDDILLEDLIPTMREDARLVQQADDLAENAQAVRAEVLLIGGARSARYFKDALSKLESTIPRSQRVELAGVGHLAADNGGRPDIVARALSAFFTVAPTRLQPDPIHDDEGVDRR